MLLVAAVARGLHAPAACLVRRQHPCSDWRSPHSLSCSTPRARTTPSQPAPSRWMAACPAVRPQVTRRPGAARPINLARPRFQSLAPRAERYPACANGSEAARAHRMPISCASASVGSGPLQRLPSRVDSYHRETPDRMRAEVADWSDATAGSAPGAAAAAGCVDHVPAAGRALAGRGCAARARGERGHGWPGPQRAWMLIAGSCPLLATAAARALVARRLVSAGGPRAPLRVHPAGRSTWATASRGSCDRAGGRCHPRP